MASPNFVHKCLLFVPLGFGERTSVRLGHPNFSPKYFLFPFLHHSDPWALPEPSSFLLPFPGTLLLSVLGDRENPPPLRSPPSLLPPIALAFAAGPARTPRPHAPSSPLPSLLLPRRAWIWPAPAPKHRIRAPTKEGSKKPAWSTSSTWSAPSGGGEAGGEGRRGPSTRTGGAPPPPTPRSTDPPWRRRQPDGDYPGPRRYCSGRRCRCSRRLLARRRRAMARACRRRR